MDGWMDGWVDVCVLSLAGDNKVCLSVRDVYPVPSVAVCGFSV